MSRIFVITQGSQKNPRWRNDVRVLFTLVSCGKRDERNTEWNFAFNGEYASKERTLRKNKNVDEEEIVTVKIQKAN